MVALAAASLGAGLTLRWDCGVAASGIRNLLVSHARWRVSISPVSGSGMMMSCAGRGGGSGEWRCGVVVLAGRELVAGWGLLNCGLAVIGRIICADLITVNIIMYSEVLA